MDNRILPQLTIRKIGLLCVPLCMGLALLGKWLYDGQVRRIVSHQVTLAGGRIYFGGDNITYILRSAGLSVANCDANITFFRSEDSQLPNRQVVNPNNHRFLSAVSAIERLALPVELDIYGCSDEDVAALQYSNNIRRLTLSSSELTDEIFEYLHAMENLEHVCIKGENRVSEAAASLFRQDHSEIAVEYLSRSP